MEWDFMVRSEAEAIEWCQQANPVSKINNDDTFLVDVGRVYSRFLAVLRHPANRQDQQLSP